MKRTMWTQEERETLIRLYPTHFAGEIAAILGKSKSSVYGQVLRLGLHAPKEKIRRAGMMSANNPRFVAARFTKGHTPDNKGKKVSPETYAKCQPTMFKKGHRPATTAPIGADTVTGKGGYVFVKIDDDPTVPSRKNWKQKHHLIYEKHYGPIPEGHIVIFLDGNNRNFDPENLRAISKATNARMNQNHLRFKERELTDTGANVAEMLTKMGKAGR